MSWTDDRVAVLRKLVADDYSASQIAKMLGGVSRNAVIGKAWRLGLKLDGAESVKLITRREARAQPPREARKRTKAKPTVCPAPAPRAEPPEGPGTATLLTLSSKVCKWPIGDPLSESFTFCGRSVLKGPYCCGHRGVAYQCEAAEADEVAEAA